MRPYDKLTGKRAIAITAAACLVGLVANAEALIMEHDGWYTWTVVAPAEAADWCCYSWRSGRANRSGCDLDSGNHGFGSSDQHKNNTGEMQIYALLRNDQVREIRALSPMCSVQSDSAITDLGAIAPGDSVAWLRSQVGRGSDVSDEALAAISVHDGRHAYSALVAAIEDRDLQREDRKQAIFWLAHSGSDEAIAYFDAIFD